MDARSPTHGALSVAVHDAFPPFPTKKIKIKMKIIKLWTPVRSLVLLSVCSPTGPMSIEQAPIDPEVVVAVDRLVLSINIWVKHCASMQMQ